MRSMFFNYDTFIEALIKLDEIIDDLKNDRNGYGNVTINVKAISGFGLIHNCNSMQIIPDKDENLNVYDGLEGFCLEDELFIMEAIMDAGVTSNLPANWLNNDYISLAFKIENLDDIVNFDNGDTNNIFKYNHIKLSISDITHIFERNLKIVNNKLCILEDSGENLSVYDKNIITIITILSIFNENDIENISIAKLADKIDEFASVKQFLIKNKNKIFY